jgi:hypothetical protein
MNLEDAPEPYNETSFDGVGIPCFLLSSECSGSFSLLILTISEPICFKRGQHLTDGIESMAGKRHIPPFQATPEAGQSNAHTLRETILRPVSVPHLLNEHRS